MRKLLSVVLLCLGVTGFVACSMDAESEASVTIQYEGYCDSVVFVHPEDTVFEKYIRDVIATKTIPLVGPNSLFSESSTTKDEYLQNAIVNCNLKAIETYENMIKNAPSKLVLSTMTALYGDSVNFEPLGYYTIYYSLYGFVNGQTVQVGTTHKDY